MRNAKYAIRINKNGEPWPAEYANTEKDAIASYEAFTTEAARNVLDGGIDDWKIVLFRRKGFSSWKRVMEYIPETVAHA